MPDLPPLHVVVVAYGGAEDLDRALAGLSPGVGPVLVVDNSSSVEVAAVCAARGVDYDDAGANLGFGVAVNRGLAAAAPGADVLLLNPDAVVDAATVRALQVALRARDDLAAVAPAQVSPDGVAARVTWPLPTPLGALVEAAGAARLRRARGHFVIGSVLLLRAEALADVGGFDPRYFLYAEETDWQRRALEAGWRVAEVASLRAVHVGAGTSTDEDRRQMLFHAGSEIYARRWSGAAGWALWRWAVVLGAAGRASLLRGAAREAALARARLYRRGPLRTLRAAHPHLVSATATAARPPRRGHGPARG